MTPLRAKYIRDLVIHGRSKHTQEAYTKYVCDLARYYRRSPELISYEEVTGWLYHLIKERQLSASSVNVAVSAVRFLYAVTLGRETLDLMASVPHMKRATPRAEVYARSEVEAILTAPRQPRDRVLLMTVYGCGLRISEATQLKTSDIDRARMQLRVRDGKGAKGRVLPLSERLLKELVNYWRAQRQGKAGHDSPWLFLGKKAGQPMSTYAGQNIYYSALKKSGVRYKGGIHTLRHSALAACCLWYTGIGRQSFPLSTLPAPTLGASLLRQPALSALPGRQKLAMARQADTESLTDQLLPLRLHSTGGSQFPDASQPAQTLPALVRLRRTESAGVRTQPTRW